MLTLLMMSLPLLNVKVGPFFCNVFIPCYTGFRYTHLIVVVMTTFGTYIEFGST